MVMTTKKKYDKELISMTSIMQHRTVYYLMVINEFKCLYWISWYPQDSIYFDFLKKYADFSMYQVKKSTKGNLEEFDKALYEDEKHDRQMSFRILSIN